MRTSALPQKGSEGRQNEMWQGDKVVGGGAGLEIPLGNLLESASAAEVTLLEPTLETIAIFTLREEVYFQRRANRPSMIFASGTPST